MKNFIRQKILKKREENIDQRNGRKIRKESRRENLTGSRRTLYQEDGRKS